MTGKISGNEILFPVNQKHNEKDRYAKIINALSCCDNVKVGKTIEGPWCDYVNCYVNNELFKLVYDHDEDETYITSENKDVLEELLVIVETF